TRSRRRWGSWSETGEGRRERGDRVSPHSGRYAVIALSRIITVLTVVELISPLASRVSSLPFLVLPLSAQSLPSRSESVMRRIVAAAAPGCAAALDAANIAIHRGAYGLAELEYRLPIGNSTFFGAG